MHKERSRARAIIGVLRKESAAADAAGKRRFAIDGSIYAESSVCFNFMASPDCELNIMTNF
jgi:hypothetical protein